MRLPACEPDSGAGASGERREVFGWLGAGTKFAVIGRRLSKHDLALWGQQLSWGGFHTDGI
jgi:hypothetical protein